MYQQHPYKQSRKICSWLRTDIMLYKNIKYKADFKTPHIFQTHYLPYRRGEMKILCRAKLTLMHKRCSLNFIILSTLMMLLLNKNSLSSCKNIRQGLWLCTRGLSCHQQACSSGVPGEGANTAFTEYMQRKINKCNLLPCLSI